jgi:hypothetical protein
MQVPAMQVPTYQPSYQHMEAAQVPSAPLPPQPVKRPLTISAPDDGGAAGLAHPQAGAALGAAHYHAGGYGAYGDEALPQRAGAAPGGRRYSAVARQGM